MNDLFKPDYTPYQMFNAGIFADWGGYFRPIYSSIAKRTIKDDYKQFDWGDLSKEKLICKPDVTKNKYGVPASLSLEEWESNGWIMPTGNNTWSFLRKKSPLVMKQPTSYRGWIGWYCLYYSGERNPEIDDIQIKRWKSVKDRFGKIKNKTPKIKQLLLNWAIKSD